ncbi:MAG: alpha-1,2-fucosyltransferase [Bacteroidetes bacterium]|nr:alpha-1,2-fucosyltransferase [Bacteroidota bacterium]
MVIVELAGGLGNQMFQYAAGRYLSLKHQTDMYLDLSFLNDRTPRADFVYREYGLEIFQLNAQFVSPEASVALRPSRRTIQRQLYSLKRMFNSSIPLYLKEADSGFDSRLFTAPSNVFLEGYWQSEEYFQEIIPAIRRDFTFVGEIDPGARELVHSLQGEHSVCLFVRRREFVTMKKIHAHHGVCSEEYFTAAVKRMSQHVPNMQLFIFSDDIDWCRTMLHFDVTTQIVDHTYAGKHFGQYLRLMSFCRHFILSNSSYCWWGAWLNNRPEKIVIAPSRWYKNPRMNMSHLFPNGWIRL